MGDYGPDFIKSFASRTRNNLEAIDHLASRLKDARKPERVYPVTQLVNSLLGLIVFPQQLWFEHLPTDYLITMGPGWARIDGKMHWKRIYNDGTVRPRTFREFAIALRNAVAHANITFSTVRRELKSVTLTNFSDQHQRSQIDFEVTLSIAELRLLAERFATQIEISASATVPAPAEAALIRTRTVTRIVSNKPDRSGDGVSH